MVLFYFSSIVIEGTRAKLAFFKCVLKRIKKRKKVYALKYEKLF